MKAAFALLPDRETFNAVSKLSWQMHRSYHTGLAVRRLPPHVSLKQPFAMEDLEGLEEYMAFLAGSIAPFPITLTQCQLWETPDSGVLSRGVQENETLRALHDRLNTELTERFGERKADFDGPSYTFHMTIAAGGGSLETYREAFAECEALSRTPTFVTRELALFLYDNHDGKGEWEYLTYKILPLSGAEG